MDSKKLFGANKTHVWRQKKVVGAKTIVGARNLFVANKVFGAKHVFGANKLLASKKVMAPKSFSAPKNCWCTDGRKNGHADLEIDGMHGWTDR